MAITKSKFKNQEYLKIIINNQLKKESFRLYQNLIFKDDYFIYCLAESV